MFSLIRDTAARFGDRPFLIASGRTYTYREIWADSLALSGRLRRDGVEPGDRVVVLLDNGPEYVRVAFALMLTGATLVPLSPRTDPATVARIRAQTAAKLVIGDDFRPGDGPPVDSRRGYEMAGDDPLVVLYTTGTTGEQKGVVLATEAVLANFGEYGERMGFGPHTRFLQPMPPYHADGWNFTLLLPFLHGACVVLPGPSVPVMCARFRDLVHGAGANVLVGVPSILAALNNSAHRYRDPSGLSCAITSSERLTSRVKHDFELTFGAEVYDLYGLTETQIVSYYAAGMPWKEGSVGKLQRGVQVRTGPDGELQVRSPYLFNGYYANPAATDAAWDGPWLHTRDLGRVDEDGYLFLEGRMNAVITRGGRKIPTHQVDAALRDHPAVAEVATLGIPDASGIEDICAFVAPRRPAAGSGGRRVPGAPGAAGVAGSPGVAELRKHCAQRLPGWACPTRVVFVDALPRTPNGKIDMVALRKIAEESEQ